MDLAGCGFARRCYVHFCPEVGFVPVNDADLITYRFRTEWLADWLVKELPISLPVCRPPLVPGCGWHLGDATCRDTLMTVVFARRVSSQQALDLLVSALRPIRPVNKAIVVTTSLQVARQVALPNGFEFLDLGDLSRSIGGRLILDRTNLDLRMRALSAWRRVRAASKSRKEPDRLNWGELDKPLLAEMHRMILGGSARNPTDAARAVARRAAGAGKESSKVTRLAASYIRLHRSD
jgi:hypothetical protein